ncbi:hypothetical protein ACWEPC_05175 [Nonomuraea sp. NPDC004297]
MGEVVKFPRPAKDAADAPPLPLPAGEREPLEGTVLPRPDNPPPGVAVTGRLLGQVARVRDADTAGTRATRTMLAATVTVGQGWHSWLTRAWDALTLGVYRRQIRAAEAIGDREALADWTERKERAVAARRTRLMELPRLALNVAKFLGISLLGALVLLLALSTAIWATGVGSFGAVWEFAGGLIRLILNVATYTWPLAPVAMLVAAWREGRRRGAAPQWLATSADADVDVEIDETTIARALGALRIAQINAYLKQGLPLQFIVPARRDGRGTYAEVRLPTGVPAEEISKPAKRAALATGLYRATKEVWPSTGAEAGILKLWVADKGALAEGAGAYPLLDGGFTDVFKGLPFGKTLRGDAMVAPVIGRNTIVGGMPDQGKSSAARVLMTGGGLDPTVELRIYVPDANYDFEVFAPRCSQYVMGAGDDRIEQILCALRDLDEEVQERGDLLIEHKEPEVTRELANAGIGLHPVMVLLEEAHIAIQHKTAGKEISGLLVNVVKLCRKRAIHVIVSTQAPTKDSMPRDVTRNCSNGIAFAVGDHVANDGLLGQGAYRAGHRATELIPGVDKGTALVKGFSGQRAEMVQAHFLSVAKGNDQVTPLLDRVMAEIERRGQSVPGHGRPAPAAIQPRDLLEDLAAVMGGETIYAADLPALLSRHAPAWPAYKTMSGKQLREDLAELGVKVPTTGNRHPVDPEAIRAALTRRHRDGETG